jgi:hypothetical protein
MRLMAHVIKWYPFTATTDMFITLTYVVEDEILIIVSSIREVSCDKLEYDFNFNA